jgi:C2 domain
MFMDGRDWWVNDKTQTNGYELEQYLETSAFENYRLTRGHVSFNKFGRRKDTLQDVGYLRGVIRVCVTNPTLDVPYNKFFNSLRQVTKVQVRVYVIRAQNLQPKDFNGFADPFVKVSLGGTVLSDRKNKQDKTLNPEIFKRFDLKTVLPGPSSLKLQVYDWNQYTSDKLIGETTIDLEDRWFHPKWTEIPVTKKPLETRNLFCKGNFLLIYICNFHDLNHFLLIYICKLHWNLNTMFVCQVIFF